MRSKSAPTRKKLNVPVSAHQLWLSLNVTGLLSVVAMVVGAETGNQPLTILAGAMFAIVATMAGWRFTTLARSAKDFDVLAARYAWLMAIAWTWAGAAMLACYYLTDLRWQHAWQYGAGMLLIAGLVAQYARARVEPGSRFATQDMAFAASLLTRIQGLAAIACVVVLAMSGKLDAAKQDWAANVVFVAGGLAIFALSTAARRAEQQFHRAAADT